MILNWKIRLHIKVKQKNSKTKRMFQKKHDKPIRTLLNELMLLSQHVS